MTRRRTLGLIFGLLVVVYIVSAAVTVRLVQDRLRDAVDRNLRSAIVGAAAALTADYTLPFPLTESQNAVIVIDGRQELSFFPAGSLANPRPKPDLSASMIISRVGKPFQTGSVTGNVEYRVLTTSLGDGRFLAIAQPLKPLNDVVNTLRWSLLITLFAVVVVLGAVFWLILRASLRPYDDMIDTAEAIARGDLDRRAAPSARSPEIEQLSQSLNTMLDRIQDSFKDKESAELRLKQFLADASHELRNPLTTIRGYSEVYLSGAATDTDSIAKQMTRINAEAARMGRLVDDLLILARLDDPREARVERIDVRAIVGDAVADARTAGPDHPLAADLGVVPLMVAGDPDSLHQVIANLLSNARAHTPPGTTVTVTLEHDDSTVTLAVADDGPGMDEDTAAHVFDRFYRADHTRTTRAGGAGLGLAIVAANVEAHAGTVALDTAPGRGTTFRVTLPRVDVAPEPGP